MERRRESNDGLQLRRANAIQAEGIKLLENHAIAPSAARLCSTERYLSKSNERTIRLAMVE
jgi:hypothetical protein